MADGHQFPHQVGGKYHYPQQTPPRHRRHWPSNGTPSNNQRSTFGTDTPSPSRSPDLQSPGQDLYRMFNQGYQQGQHGRMPMMYNLQHQGSRQQQAQYHASLQQHHTAQGLHANQLAQQVYSSGAMSNSTPSLTPNPLQTGHSATPQEEPQSMNPHWEEQLRLYKESQKAHEAMTERYAPHYYCKTNAWANARLSTAQDGERDEQGRPLNKDRANKHQDWDGMDLSGLGLRVLATSLFNYNFLTDLYVASNKISQLPSAVRHLRSLKHLDASNNQLVELPAELGMCMFLKDLLLFDNHIRTLPYELGSLYQLEMLGIEGNPLDPYMKDEIMERGTKALINRLREEAPVPAPPPARSMLDLQDEAPSNEQNRFKVFSYNILCDNYVNSQQYPYTPSHALDWEYRKELILQDIQAQDPDIVCLQEINTESFEEFFSMKLAYADYKGVFFPKGRAKTMSEKNAKVADGCATFYKGSKYLLLDKHLIDFANIAINRPDMKNQHDIFNRVGSRDDIAVATFFENKLTGGRFVIVNTHIFWNPAYADVKLIQVAIMMENMSRLAEKYARWPATKNKKKFTAGDEDSDPLAPADPDIEFVPSIEYMSGTQLPLILCTDLNSTPDSSVYELLSTGSVAPDHHELGGYQYGHFTRDGIQHPFSLRSAYSLLDGTPSELTFTNYTPTFTGMIDHIWYSTNTLEVTSLLGPFDAEYMKRVPGFPNWHFPSDHIPLVAELLVKSRKEKKNVLEPAGRP